MLKWVKSTVQFIDSVVPNQPFSVVDHTPTSKILLSTFITVSGRVNVFDFGILIATI